jgi:hypothetical protein
MKTARPLNLWIVLLVFVLFAYGCAHSPLICVPIRVDDMQALACVSIDDFNKARQAETRPTAPTRHQAPAPVVPGERQI